MKAKLWVSFSGGRTSAYMTKKLLDKFADFYEMKVVFANTGQEDDRTLAFVDACDREFGFNTVWLEAEVSPEKGRGTTFRVVDFATASRDGRPFRDVVAKYGVSNPAYPHCTRELKLQPMRSYIRSIGWSDASVAVGIRADEARRVAHDAAKHRVVYPLIEWFPTDKEDVNTWWGDQSFQLGLEEYQGNCLWCWKKSDPKLIRMAQERPEVFELPAELERTHGGVGCTPDTRRVFFRRGRSAEDMLALSQAVGPAVGRPPTGEFIGGCGESCEINFDDLEDLL